MKFAGRGRVNRRDLNWLFGKKTGRPDAECWVLEKFLVNTIMGNSECKDITDVKIFMHEYGIKPTHWRKWFASHNPDDLYWVVVETQMGETVWTYFKHSRQMGAWVSLDEECVITFKLVPRGGGSRIVDKVAL